MNKLSQNILQRSRFILWPIALIYRMAVGIRNLCFELKILPSKSFEIPVISVGNITVGGTGKTPHVEFLTDLLLKHYQIAILSRGYKRQTTDFLTVSATSGVHETGDEPLQIKRKFPSVTVAVDRNRVHGIQKLTEMIPKPEVVILDDAFQHRYLKPGLSVLLIDYNRPIYKDMMLPAGNLREPWRNLIRADMIIITKCPPLLSSIDKARFISRVKRRSDQEVFFTTYAYGDPRPVFPGQKHKSKALKYKSLLKKKAKAILVTGIANPEPLREYLGNSVHISEALAFPDHHAFNETDLKKIALSFHRLVSEEKYIFVTEKDAVKIRTLSVKDKPLRKAFYYIPIEVKFLSKGEKPFIKRILKFLKKSL